MEVYLLQFSAESLVFYSEERRAAHLAEPRDGLSERIPEDGALSRRLERMWRAWRERMQRVAIGRPKSLMRLQNWLRRFSAPDEGLLQRLRAATQITLFYPATMSRDEADAAWRTYLRRRARQQLLRLMANALILPLTLLLAPLPGPNLIGYWFAYRALCHYLAVRGVRRARAERKITVRFEPSDRLSYIGEGALCEQLTDVATHFDLPKLTQFIKRLGAQSATKPAASLIAL